MSESFFCETCFHDVEADVTEALESATVRGVTVSALCAHVICPHCGSRIADPALTDANLARIYTAFRDLQNIPQPQELRALRERYGLSQRQFALLIGIGLASLQRYEQGSLPSESHAEILRNAFDLRYLKKRLRERTADFSEKDCEAIALSLDREANAYPRFEYQVIALNDLMPVSKSIFTGNTLFSPQKLKEAIALFAQHSKSLYKTKLSKALFYLDFSLFRDRKAGATGLQYIHADYGPAPNGYESWMHEFVDGADLRYEEQENGGQIITLHSTCNPQELSSAEIDRIKRVATFIDRFPTVTSLSEVSHGEDAWIKTANGELISYDFAKTLRGI